MAQTTLGTRRSFECSGTLAPLCEFVDKDRIIKQATRNTETAIWPYSDVNAFHNRYTLPFFCHVSRDGITVLELYDVSVSTNYKARFVLVWKLGVNYKK